MTHVQQKNSWFWGCVFLGMGLTNIAIDFWKRGTGLHLVMTGVAILLMAPLASLRFPDGRRLILAAGILGMLLLAVAPLIH